MKVFRVAKNRIAIVSCCSVLLLAGCNAASRHISSRVTPSPISPNTSALQNAAAPDGSLIKTFTNPVVTIPILSASEESAISQEQNRAATWAQSVLRLKIKPVASGNGVIISEPQGAATSSTRDQIQRRDFGAGCSRWLQLQVGGQGALGKTPLWNTIDEARRVLKITQPVVARDVPRLAFYTSATHVAVANVNGNAQKTNLTYQVLDARGKIVGAPISMMGSQSQIVAALPRIARQIAARLGARDANFATPKIAASDVTFLGSLPFAQRDNYQELAREDEARLRRLANMESLAGVLWMSNDARDGDEKTLWLSVMRPLMARAGDNALVISSIAWEKSTYLEPYAARVRATMRRFPHNFALCVADCRWSNDRNDAKTQLDAAQRCVAGSPRNAERRSMSTRLSSSWATARLTWGGPRT